MSNREIPYYTDYVSGEFQKYLENEAKEYPGVAGLVHIGETGGLENSESLKFTCDLYDCVKGELLKVLNQRAVDRKFIDERVKVFYELNEEYENDFESNEYQTIIGQEDSQGRIVIGPKLENYSGKSDCAKIAPIPDYLQGFHVTLFGPPDDAKLSVNAMNAYHRKLKDEPAIISEILKTNKETPKWGADDEDSKTPLRSDLISASTNLTDCLNGEISFYDEKRDKNYKLESEMLSYPIKRFPGLALPTTFLFYYRNPLPLHLYDFALHLFEHWSNPRALTFYVPKLENEEEAAYIKIMIKSAEKMIQKIHPEYKIGTVRVIIVLENPRAVFRVNEVIDALYPYFVGASLGWHDYLGSTARLMKNDANYRIPVKADPDIVIKYIKASHDLLANVVGERGGIKIGGMYGILPITNELFSDSFQITMRGFFRDVITQMKRDLSGYWVAHPDFVRIGIAIVEAWRIHANGDSSKLLGITNALLNEKYAKEVWDFVLADDIEGLDYTDPLYARSLIVADIKESSFIANNHPDEIRYNVFQMLQYLTDWLTGNGCVALPTQINGIPARVMDDLATAERSRWEVWHEIHHGRFRVEDFIKIAHEEMNFIRRDLSNDKKIVEVKYTEENSKWYEVAFKLMLKLMTDKEPVEFATELLLPFTIESLRENPEPWEKITEVDTEKFKIDSYVEKYNFYFENCGSEKFASENVRNLFVDESCMRKSIMEFSKDDIVQAAGFHGDIGQSAKTLDSVAKLEQQSVSNDSAELQHKLLSLGIEYSNKFKMKFLVSAKGKIGSELLNILESRINNLETEEIENAKKALFEITIKRMGTDKVSDPQEKLKNIFKQSNIQGTQISISSAKGSYQNLSFGSKGNNSTVDYDTQFQIASLSKTFATAFALEFFVDQGISESDKVNDILRKHKSSFLLTSSVDESWGDLVQIKHLMSHCALNMHYVEGVMSTDAIPDISDLVIDVINKPGTKFKYSGAGFIVLQYLIELIGQSDLNSLSKNFFKHLGLSHMDFSPEMNKSNFSVGFSDTKEGIEGGYKKFPGFAAGMWGTAADVLKFLEHIASAFDDVEGSGGISHDTAVHMTYGTDKGCKPFMNTLMGMGVFTIEAGENEFLLHQGANDGFRAIYLYCYKGPDKYKGFCITSTGELNGVLYISQASQLLLKELGIQGIDYNKFQTNFESKNLSSEQIVNIGYKDLFLNAFKATLPEQIKGEKLKCTYADFNLLDNAEIVSVSNQRFARAVNLLSPYDPVFDPAEFGRQGKVMDSWESARHNPEDFDYINLKLSKKSDINFVFLSTKYHDGNQVEWVEILSDENTLLRKTRLEGHSALNIKLNETIPGCENITIRVFPDGGLTRVALFDELPPDHPAEFLPEDEAFCIRFKESIPQSLKPLGINPHYFKKNDYSKKLNYASLALGAKVVSATDEHYAPAENVLSPFKPLNMFDGLESRRSREKNHFEEVVIELATSIIPNEIHFDFTYFVNNNPKELSVFCESESDGKWIPLFEKYSCKEYAGNYLVLKSDQGIKSNKIKVQLYPDGGVNRVKVYGKE